MRALGLVFCACMAWSGGVSGARAATDDDRGVWYAMPSYHQAGLEKATVKVRQPSGDMKFDANFGDDTGPGLAVGYAFRTPYRLDVELQRQDNDLKTPSSNPLGKSSLKAVTVDVNAWRDFAPWHQLRPYLGAGLGAGKLELESLDTNFYVARIGAGVQWYFRPRMAVDIGYRYQFALSNPELSGNGAKLSTDYASQAVQIGFRFDFGGG